MSRATVGVIAAVVVAGVLFVAGISKLARPGEWKTQAAGLGAPAPVATVLPFVELLLGAALLVQLNRSLFGWCAVGLFVVFTVLLSVRLAQGRRPPCACFGSLSSKPIGPGHLARNALFIALAAAAATL